MLEINCNTEISPHPQPLSVFDPLMLNLSIYLSPPSYSVSVSLSLPASPTFWFLSFTLVLCTLIYYTVVTHTIFYPLDGQLISSVQSAIISCVLWPTYGFISLDTQSSSGFSISELLSSLGAARPSRKWPGDKRYERWYAWSVWPEPCRAGMARPSGLGVDTSV